VTVFLMGALVALCVWLYIDLIIVAREASQIRPFTERAANVAAVCSSSTAHSTAHSTQRTDTAV
jgi:hypothetical protein